MTIPRNTFKITKRRIGMLSLCSWVLKAKNLGPHLQDFKLAGAANKKKCDEALGQAWFGVRSDSALTLPLLINL